MTAPHMPMMNELGLLECPFCGGDPFTEKLSNGFAVECSDCNCSTGSRLSMVLAAYRWNTRNGHLWTKQDFADRAFEMQNSDLLEKK